MVNNNPCTLLNLCTSKIEELVPGLARPLVFVVSQSSFHPMPLAGLVNVRDADIWTFSWSLCRSALSRPLSLLLSDNATTTVVPCAQQSAKTMKMEGRKPHKKYACIAEQGFSRELVNTRAHLSLL